MATEIKVPELGESVNEARVGRWMKKKGDHVRRGEVVVELETDKVDLEVSADDEGVLSSIEQDEGANVQIGDVLGRIEPAEAEPGEEARKKRSQGRKKDAATPAAEEAEAGDEVAPTEEKKKKKREEAPAARAEETRGEQGARGEERQADREKDVGAERPDAENEDAGEAPPDQEEGAAAELATPTAKRMAKESGVDLDAIRGSGDQGRIIKRDVVQFIADRKSGRSDSEEESERREERVPMSSRRRTIARRLVEAQQTAAMLTTFNEVDMGAVQDLRERYADTFEKEHGVRLGIVSFFVKAVIGGLKKFPRINAELDGDEIVLKHYYDIGVAVGAEEGLVVPVIRDADKKSIIELEKSIKELARRAKENELAIKDLQGGTFTLSNGGVFGSLMSTPILNPPQVGILGLHKIELRPYVIEGEVRVRPLMYVALSYDHRLVDGLEAVQFLVHVKSLIEGPERMVIES